MGIEQKLVEILVRKGKPHLKVDQLEGEAERCPSNQYTNLHGLLRAQSPPK